jgi:hypothetical protein
LVPPSAPIEPFEIVTNAYLKNGEIRDIEALEAHPLGPAIVALMQRTDEWKGKPSKLLAELEEIAGEERISTKSGGWPKSPSALSRRLSEIRTNLQNIGIGFDVTKSGDRSVRIWKMPPILPEPPK